MSSVVSKLFGLGFMLLFVASGLVHAESRQSTLGFGVTVGASYWQQNYSGDFKISEFDIRPVDVESDLSIGSEYNPFFFLVFAHANQYAPQIRVQKTVIQSTKNTVIQPSRFFSLGGSSNLFGDLRAIRSEMDFDHMDIDLFYPVWASTQNESELNLGFTLRKFDGFTFVTTTDNDSSKCTFEENYAGCSVGYRLDFTDKVPLLYLNSRIDFGIPSLSLNTQLHYGNYKKNEMTDVDINIAYRLPIHLSLYLGYRHAILDLGDFSGLVADITTSGIYSGFSFHF